MNMQHRDEGQDDRFDEAMRALHRSAVAQVSPQVRWQLRPASRPAGGVAGRFADWRVDMAFAGTAAAIFAVAVGLGLRDPAGTGTVPVEAAPAASPAAAGVLDQDPDFYAWLASDDAELVAME